ncbi:hypothetical protein NHX12_029704 [Muraenolepis orangiensis]|uniref:Uncharacterized protein n=1 Tax=Muraenolepis orangiensis TaxID=630683 RepID=A0A9Q0E8T3_9TELE|nr:hypothetical protein NHX12_029704 [Muraenolepis orangiensis]
MSILAAYLRKWRLQLSTGKTVSAAYHLCNGEAKRELSVSVDNKRLEHQLAPKYLGVRLDRTLSYKRHLEEVRAKVTARVSLIRRLAGTTWGASARTLRISTQALVFSAAEYCAPVWSRSPHVKKVDPIINNALRIITVEEEEVGRRCLGGFESTGCGKGRILFFLGLPIEREGFGFKHDISVELRRLLRDPRLTPEDYRPVEYTR